MIKQKYLKYCSIQQLRNQIDNRFDNVHDKITKVQLTNKQFHHHEKPNESLLNRKFYDYVTEIKQKQREYQNIMNQSEELASLLDKRKRKIDQSLEKYESNHRSKTLSNFHDVKKKDDLNNSMQIVVSPFDSLIINGIKSKDYSRERLKTIDNLHINRKDDKKDYYSIAQRQQNKRLKTQGGEYKSQQNNRLKSITNVISISINNTNKKQLKLFTFQKKNPQRKQKRQYNEQKKLNFTDIMDEKQKIKKKIIKNEQQKKNKKIRPPKVDLTYLTLKQKIQSKIKQRIKQNYDHVYTQSIKKPNIQSNLDLIFNQQKSQKLQLKRKILCHFNYYLKFKSTKMKVNTCYQQK